MNITMINTSITQQVNIYKVSFSGVFMSQFPTHLYFKNNAEEFHSHKTFYSHKTLIKAQLRLAKNKIL